NVGLNYGIVGLGANNSASTYGNIVVQVPTPATTFTYNEDFTDGVAQYFAPATSGAWTINNSTGTYTGSASSGSTAISLMDPGLAVGMAPGTFALQSTSLLDLKATFQTATRAGLIYDYYNPGYFKFAALLADTQQVVLGHYTTKGGWVFDEVAKYTVQTGTSYTLELTGKGSTVSLTVNGAAVLSHIYNAVVVDGKFGLISINGPSTFSLAYLRTDDSNLPTQTVQHMDAAAAPTGPPLGDTSLTKAELNTLLNAAIDRLSAALALGASSIAALPAATIPNSDLP